MPQDPITGERLPYPGDPDYQGTTRRKRRPNLRLTIQVHGCRSVEGHQQQANKRCSGTRILNLVGPRRKPEPWPRNEPPLVRGRVLCRDHRSMTCRQ